MENSIVHKFITLILIAPIMGGYFSMRGFLEDDVFLIMFLSVELVLLLFCFSKDGIGMVDWFHYSLIAFMSTLAFVLCTGYGYDPTVLMIVVVMALSLILVLALKYFSNFIGNNSGYKIVLTVIATSTIVVLVTWNTALINKITVDGLASFVGVIIFSAFTLNDFSKIDKSERKGVKLPHAVGNVYLDFVLLCSFALYFISAVKFVYLIS